MNQSPVQSAVKLAKGLSLSPEEIIADYRLAYRSRQASLIGRREVLSGKGKFGIFGDGKEVAQLAMARAARPGDFRSGYYRDQTFAMATGIQTLEQFFAQLYADADPEREPNSMGRQMNAHFASRNLDPDGNWRDLTAQYNIHADCSSTASQMPRIAGLAQASKLYRELPELAAYKSFSNNGDEVVFGTIGNASSAEGHFWETLNAIGVLGVPAVVAIWDDEYGISVPNEHQLTRSLSEMLSGFQRNKNGRGIELITVAGWDYPALCTAFEKATNLARKQHIPCVIHVTELTQPQGHSTSGSHERYKTPERLVWEQEYDCLVKMRAWMLEQGIADPAQLEAWEEEDRKTVRELKNAAWQAYQAPIRELVAEAAARIEALAETTGSAQAAILEVAAKLRQEREPFRAHVMEAIHKTLRLAAAAQADTTALSEWRLQKLGEYRKLYGKYLYSESVQAAIRVKAVAPLYSDESQMLSGFEILNRCFDLMFARDARVVAFGEDVGFLGDVNQGFAGLQAKYGPLRVADTGIREATIAGQAIGLAARGLRPIAEIQYLDYFLYALQTLSDDLACLHYRCAGIQKAPAIIRTRGHRLEGIWHSGSPMGVLLNALRGMHLLVPRNMTQAAGFYNTLLLGDEPAVVIEVLNGYRLKEKCPDNLGDFTLPLGLPETLREGSDVSVVTYGACCRIAMEAAEQLAEIGIETEVIDVQSLLPFDREHRIVESIKKTNRVVFFDEDVPGGASAYMMQQVVEGQNAWRWLDSPPVTLSAQAHRPAFGTDGDYFSKPQVEDVFRAVYELMSEAEPIRFPAW